MAEILRYFFFGGALGFGFGLRPFLTSSVPAASLGDGLLAFSGRYSASVVLLDVSGDGIEVLSQFELPGAGEVPHPRSFARQGNRLWICATTFSGPAPASCWR